MKQQAVLFRASHHSGSLEVELTRRNIPFVKFGGLKFLDAAHRIGGSSIATACARRGQDKENSRDAMVEMGCHHAASRDIAGAALDGEIVAESSTARSRSDSLTRNSARPRIRVSPEAYAAATARMGYSSIIEGRDVLNRLILLEKLRATIPD